MQAHTNKILIDSIVKEYVQMYGLDLDTAEKLAGELSLLDEAKLAHAYKKAHEHIEYENSLMAV